MTAGLLTLVLCAGPSAEPQGAVSPTVSSTVRIPSSYHPVVAGIQSTAGRATVVGGESTVAIPTGPIGRHIATAVGQVFEPAFSLENNVSEPPTGYQPQAGDIVFFVSDLWYWSVLYTVALTGEPYHVGIVVQMDDGSFRVLEAGPPEVTRQIQLAPLPERLESYSGRVFIRRRAEPLTPEQTEALAGFACRQEGKRYALFRFLCQGTPFRCRGPLRTDFMGKSRGEPSSFFCSELVTESLVAVGELDAETARPRATVMADLFYDESSNPHINKHLKLCPHWTPPQQWVGPAFRPAK